MVDSPCVSEGKEEVSFALGYCLDRLKSNLDGLKNALIAEIHRVVVSKEVPQNIGVSVRSSLKSSGSAKNVELLSFTGDDLVAWITRAKKGHHPFIVLESIIMI